ncbi:MAG: aminotransferase class I/II-fold pyridoxal phosphate-dependent enzyme [Methylophilaceae bacterium]
MNKTDLKFSTRCIHTGLANDGFGSPNTPLYDTTTFSFSSTEKMEKVIEGHDIGYLYTRYGSNPSIVNVEKKLASLELAETAIAFSSGMAAIATTLITHGEKGIICLGEVYGGTWELMTSQLSSLGRDVAFISPNQVDALEIQLKQGYTLVYFETPSNPLLQLIDINKICNLAHTYGAIVVIDSTFATPVNQQTLTLGADIVIHSATKYLGGHSDLTGGMVAGKSSLLEPIKVWRKNLGQIMAPEVAHLLSRSLATLELRVQRQNLSAMRIAQFLQNHHAIEKVYYPGLTTHTGHNIAKKQMTGFGGMVSILLKNNVVSPVKFVDSLALFLLAPSLGGCESLVCQPTITSHRDLSAEMKKESGITDNLIRISIGLEDPSDLEADLLQALELM